MNKAITIGLIGGALAAAGVVIVIAEDEAEPGCADFNAAAWLAKEDRDFHADALENCPSLLVGKSRAEAYRLLGEKHSTWKPSQVRSVPHDTWFVSFNDGARRALTLEYERDSVSTLSVHTGSPDPFFGFD